MKDFLNILLIIILFSCESKENKIETNISFNFDAAKGYFNVVDSLKIIQKLSDAQWKSFLEIEGNKLYLTENNIPKTFTDKLRTIIENTYTVSDSLLIANSERDLFYKIRSMYRENDSVFRDHLDWIKKNETRVIDSMVARTMQFLPQNKLTNDSPLKIYYHTLDHDGSANAKGIFISIMAAHQNNSKRLGNYEAHEFHHIQRPNILNEIKIDSIDQEIVWALDAALNEGLADMVDKDVMLSEQSDWWLKDMVNDFYVGEAKAVIENLDKLITDEANGKHHSEEEYRNTLLGTVGHVPGYFMAKIITENGKSDELTKMADNPFSFFMLYNEIACQNPKEYPLFTAVSIQYIKELEQKYNNTD